MSQQKFRYFVILGTMRSGSNLLEQSLNQFPDIRCYGELFNPAFIGAPKDAETFGFSLSKREKSPESLLDAMIGATETGIAGFRIFDGHDPRILDKVLQDESCAKIILRRDLLDSYISLKIARKTDQWLLHNAPHRKHTKVRFDAAEFAAFRQEKQAYFDRIRKILQESGQTAFDLEYPAQKDVAVLNGLARFLGAEGRLKKLKENIRRQNPEPLSEKVENFAEMQAAVPVGDKGRMMPEHPVLRANIPKMVSCLAHPVLFAPIPGGPTGEVLRWMHALDGGQPIEDMQAAVDDGTALHTGHNRRTLFEWMQANPGLITLTAVRHPVVRAYFAFMTKIFPTGPGGYDVIRRQLIDNYGLELPARGETYALKDHRAAFHGFLRFLKSNLAGQTSIRIDGLWAPQMAFVTGFNTAVPVSLIAYEGRLDAAFRYAETMLDIERPQLEPPLQPDYEFPLDAVYTRQTENLTRKVYGMDYTRFGFDDYQAALDV